MSYAALGTTRVVSEGLLALPKCYSKEFDDCIEERSNSYPRCDMVNQAYEEDFDRMEKAVDAIPYCSDATYEQEVCAHQRKMLIGMTVAAGLMSLAVLFKTLPDLLGNEG